MKAIQLAAALPAALLPIAPAAGAAPPRGLAPGIHYNGQMAPGAPAASPGGPLPAAAAAIPQARPASPPPAPALVQATGEGAAPRPFNLIDNCYIFRSQRLLGAGRMGAGGFTGFVAGVAVSPHSNTTYGAEGVMALLAGSGGQAHVADCSVPDADGREGLSCARYYAYDLPESSMQYGVLSYVPNIMAYVKSVPGAERCFPGAGEAANDPIDNCWLLSGKVYGSDMKYIGVGAVSASGFSGFVAPLFNHELAVIADSAQAIVGYMAGSGGSADVSACTINYLTEEQPSPEKQLACAYIASIAQPYNRYLDRWQYQYQNFPNRISYVKDIPGAAPCLPE